MYDCYARDGKTKLLKYINSRKTMSEARQSIEQSIKNERIPFSFVWKFNRAVAFVASEIVIGFFESAENVDKPMHMNIPKECEKQP